MPSPLVGLLLISAGPPGRTSPPINSLPPRLCPWIGLGRVGESAEGECGGEVPVVGAAEPAGLKENSGSALTDFCLWCGIEPRRPVGYGWSDIGRGFDGAGPEEATSGPRMGKENSGLGMSSTGPALDCWRRW